jgi:hypothetical protein
MKHAGRRQNDFNVHGWFLFEGGDAPLHFFCLLLQRLADRRPRLSARAGSRRFGRLSALCAHTKAPYKMYFHRKTLRNAETA